MAFCCTFFSDGKGDRLERSVEGLYRALLAQLLTRYRCSQSRLAESLAECQQQQSKGGNESNGSEAPWNEAEMMKALEETINGQRGERIILFIDAIDECDSDRARDIAYFLRDLTDSAYSCGVHLSVCFNYWQALPLHLAQELPRDLRRRLQRCRHRALCKAKVRSRGS
jgi:protein SERAC1